MPDNSTPLKPGDKLRAGPIEAMRSVAARIRLAVQWPLELRTGPGGWFLRYAGPEEFWCKITSAGSSGKYAWTEQVPLSGGSWQDGHKSGTTSSTPAIEINGNNSVPLHSIVWIRKDSTEMNFRFIFSACS